MNYRKKFFFILLALLGVATYYTVILFQDAFGVADELPAYSIPLKHSDDTLRVAIIGDSWAYNHSVFQCDTLFEYYAKRLISRPVKCVSKGHNGQKTKGVYQDMFANRPVKYEWEREYCTQSLIEEHPDYCIIMAGINDLCRQKPISYYTGNYLRILHMLIENEIRPVVMEIPQFDVNNACYTMGTSVYIQSRLISFFTGAGWDDVSIYQIALRNALEDAGITSKVLFIPASKWNSGGIKKMPHLYTDDCFHLNRNGYYVLDSCMAYEIVNDIYIK